MYKLQENSVSLINDLDLFSITTMFFPKDTSPILHTESRFLYVAEGEGIIKINNNEYIIKPNTIISLINWNISQITKVTKKIKLYRLVYSHIYIQHVLKIMSPENASILNDLDNNPVVNLEISKKYMDLFFSQIINEIGDEAFISSKKEKDEFTFNFLTAKTIEIIIHIQRSLKNSNLVKAENIKNDIELEILKFIYSNSSHKITLDYLSKKFYINKTKLLKMLEEYTGFTFNQILNQIKIKKIDDLILNTTLTLEEIAKINGFSNQSYLSQFYKKNVGFTPNEFKNRKNSINDHTFKFKETEIAILIVKYIEKNYYKNLKISDLSSEFNLSNKEINKLLLFYVEENFNNFLNRVRINKASKLILSTDEDISNICFLVGYNNIKTFKNNFLKFKGFSPFTLREKNIYLQKNEA